MTNERLWSGWGSGGPVVGRRALLGGALGAATLAGLAACGSSGSGASSSGGSSGGKLSVLTYGGGIADVQQKLVVPQMKQKYGIDVSVTAAGVIATTINSQLKQPKYDVFVDSAVFLPILPKIYQKVDTGKIDNYDQVFPAYQQSIGDLGIPAYATSYCICYDDRVFSTPPTLEDFTNPKYKGKVVVQATPNTMYFAPMLLKTFGGSIDNPQPMFDWFKKVIPNLLTDYTSSTQPAQLFENGDIVLALWYSGRAADVKNAGGHVGWTNDGAIANIVSMSAVSGTKSLDAAEKYMGVWLSPEIQEQVLVQGGDSPVTKNAKLTAEETAKLPVTPDDIAKMINPKWADYAPHLQEWQAKYDDMRQG